MGFNSGSAPQTHFIVCEVKRSKVNCFKMRIKAKVTLECAGIFFGISLLSLFLAYSWTGPHISWNKLTAVGSSPEFPGATYSSLGKERVSGKKKVVLVTGAAGFIGFHLSAALHKMADVEVVAVDGFVNNVDPRLHLDRAEELRKLNVRLFRGDVCDRIFLRFLFESFSISHVVHLAACAGVRKSMEEPASYLRNNVDCFLTLLHTMKQREVTLLFASSSSTYGHASPLPLSPASDLPPFSASSVYAATKISNEMFATSFCRQYHLMVVGLRFFTVYGPWGRPDMAVYKFAQSILDGGVVTLYNSSKPLGRDFTFISDVVDGIVLALDHTPSRCGEIFNIGHGESVSVKKVVELLETALHTTARLVTKPLPLSDMPHTLADITMSRRVLDYSPVVEVEEGVRRFAEWLLWYREERRKARPENTSLEKMLQLGERRVEQVRRKYIEEQNMEYRQRIAKLRNKYNNFARRMDIEGPAELKKGRFIKHTGVASEGSTIAKLKLRGTGIQQLAHQCRLTEQCVAFTSTGELKSRLQPRKKWVESNDTQRLYVADIDVCSVDLHSCGKHEECIYTGPAMHSCSCRGSYVRSGSGCLERYVNGSAGEKERGLVMADYFEGRDWAKMAAGREFVFFQGVNSPGGDYLVVGDRNTSIAAMKEVCLSVHHCLGFNSNGILKHSLRPPHSWRSSSSGLYVLDVDYCSLQMERCPPLSRCHRLSPGKYDCRCHTPYIMNPSHSRCVLEPPPLPTLLDSCAGGGVHIILSLDREALPGLLPLLHSLLAHHTPSSVQLLHLHVVVSGLTEAQLLEYISCYFTLPGHVTLEVVRLDPSLLDGLIKVYTPTKQAGNLASLANYARFFFHRLFPSLKKVLYLDMDVIVQADVRELWEELCLSQNLLLAAPRNLKYSKFFSPKIQASYKARYGGYLDLEQKTFNAGVYGVNLDLWRSRDVHTEVLYWLDKQYREPLWKFGTQPVLLLVAYRQWSEMDPLWNVNGLGWQGNIGEDTIRKAKLLHWTGKGKPWLPGSLYREAWLRHVTDVCSGHGTCEQISGGGFACRCRHGYSGTRCKQQQ